MNKKVIGENTLFVIINQCLIQKNLWGLKYKKRKDVFNYVINNETAPNFRKTL